MNDDELLPPEWGKLWRTGENPRAADIVRDVKRRTRLLAVRAALETAVALLGAGALILVARANAHPSDRPFGALYAAAVVVFGAYALLNARGTWRSRGERPIDYARLQVLRAERRVRSVRAGFAFLALSIVLYVPWILSRTSGPGANAAGLLYLGIFVSVYVFILQRELIRARVDENLWRKAADQLADTD